MLLPSGIGISLRNFFHFVEVNIFEKITRNQMVANALCNKEIW